MILASVVFFGKTLGVTISTARDRRGPQGTARDRKGPQVTARDLENTTRDHRGSLETTGNLYEMDETIVWDSANLRQFAFTSPFIYILITRVHIACICLACRRVSIDVS